MNEIIVEKKVADLGACAYLLMHGFKVSGCSERPHKTFRFKISESEIQDFEDKQMEYLSSEFHRFDSCLMSLKKWKSSE